MSRGTKIEIKGTVYSMRLGDLRWFIEKTKSLPDNTSAILHIDQPPQYHPTDTGSSSLSVHIPNDTLRDEGVTS